MSILKSRYFSRSGARKAVKRSGKALSRAGDYISSSASRNVLSRHPVSSALGGLFLLSVIAAAIWLFPEYRRYIKVRQM